MVADVTVVGAGVIALACSVALGDRGVHVCLVGTPGHGEASSASAGMLAPSVEPDVGPLHTLAIASRDQYPGYLAALQARTGIAVPHNAFGIVEVATTTKRADELRGRAGAPSAWLEPASLRALEPAITPAALGGVLHPADGAVDPVRLLDALRVAVERHPRVTVVPENVRAVRVDGPGVRVETNGERQCESAAVVIAAGAWTPTIAGVPRLAVEPVRGQMVAYAAHPLRHVVYGERGYLVPRGERTVAGSTMEHAGFHAVTTEAGIAVVREGAEATVPALAKSAVLSTWAGLRPMTPDGLPILGPDAMHPAVVYACGHSRNGILLTPVTAEIIADVVTGATPRYDLARFRADRFPG